MTEAERGPILLAIARGALAESLGAGAEPPPAADWLEEQGATFVTLEIDGELRGCIGSIVPYRPLGDDVRENARAAAFRDPRFPQLTARELARVRIEVSVLSELEPIECDSEQELLRQLRPGVDGLLLEHGAQRGTFLPSVWRHHPEPADFLRQLKRKARLDPGFWSPDVRVQRYTVESWHEPVAGGQRQGS